MNRKYIIIFLVIAFAGGIFVYLRRPLLDNSPANTQDLIKDSLPIQNNIVENNSKVFMPPLDQAGERVTKKPFSIFVSPQDSPVQPERFRGYHTGIDFEVFSNELNAEVKVKAVCEGKIKIKKYATGYGGVMVEDCNLNGNPITVVYGHLKLASISKNVGESLLPGEEIGILGADKSIETDNERKNLHLGFYNGTSLNILGYIQNKSELSGWLNPCDYGVCQ